MASSERIPVIGGAGFIGSFLCERLLADGHEVLRVDKVFAGRRKSVAYFRAALA